MQILRPKKHSLILKKPHLRPKKLKIMLKKLNILLKKQRLYYFFFKSDEAIVNSNLMLNKLRPSQRSIKKQLKNKTNRRKICLNYQIIRSRNFKLNLEKSLDEVYCEHCHEEFEDQNSIMITSTLVLYVKRLSRNNQQNHIQYDHQELYCYNHDKYISHNCQI